MVSPDQSVTVLSGFPLYSGPRSNDTAADTDCPYSTKLMLDYLNDCFAKYDPNDAPKEFSDFKLREKLVFGNRVFWVWSCADEKTQIWHCVVGEGKSTHPEKADFETFLYAEMYAELYDPIQIIQKEFPEYSGQTGKLN